MYVLTEVATEELNALQRKLDYQWGPDVRS
ncbi:hypothetical protein ACFY05_27220 [Microtetraspora fusca]|uniref:Uncharacterized protein n=1 Tax=Microtetraspora fusca TaxID=1997 RepID=A0ABW6VFJ1_MICFU